MLFDLLDSHKILATSSTSPAPQRCTILLHSERQSNFTMNAQPPLEADCSAGRDLRQHLHMLCKPSHYRHILPHVIPPTDGIFHKLHTFWETMLEHAVSIPMYVQYPVAVVCGCVLYF